MKEKMSAQERKEAFVVSVQQAVEAGFLDELLELFCPYDDLVDAWTVNTHWASTTVGHVVDWVDARLAHEQAGVESGEYPLPGEMDVRLLSWEKVLPEDVLPEDMPLIVQAAITQSIDVVEAYTGKFVPQRFEPASLILGCGACHKALEILSHLRKFVACQWNDCNAVTGIHLDLATKTYVPYTLCELPAGWLL